MFDAVASGLTPLLILGVGVLAVVVWRTAETRRLAALREVCLILGAYVVYFTLRGTTEGHVETAQANAALIMEFQEEIGILVEPMLQEAALAHGWLVTLVNWIYTWGHWPVIAGVAVWLYCSHRADYRLVRNAFLISGAIGLVFFTLFPVAPPRLADVGMKDTLTAYSMVYEWLYPASLANQYAAMPSLHFGWNLLIAIAIARHIPRPPLRPLIVVLLPTLMLASIVLTANHYIVDAVAGGAVALAGFAIAWRFRPQGAGTGALSAA